MSNMNQIASDLYKALTEADERKTKPYDTKAEVVRTEGETAWVKIPGGVEETPVQKTNNANPGDTVMVRVAGGRAWLLGNNTSPATDDTQANAATQLAVGAGNLAEVASKAASEAQESASIAYSYADQAKESAEQADENARSASESATSALYGLSTVQDIVGTLNWVEENADYIWAVDEKFYEQTVYYMVKNTNYTPKKITLDIVNSFLYRPIFNEVGRLGYVKYKNEESLNFQVVDEPLVGELSEYYEKINDNDEYVLTSDEEIDVTKTYYSMIGDIGPQAVGSIYMEVSFEKVENPVADELYKYYTADTQTSMANYIKSHLALTDDGLYVMQDGSGWKYKVTNEGAYILDPGNIPKAIYKTDVQLGNDLDPHRMILSALALSFFFNQKLVGKFGYDEMFESYGLYAENVLIKGAGNALRLDNAVNGTYQGQYILETRANGHLSLKPGLRRTEED